MNSSSHLNTKVLSSALALINKSRHEISSTAYYYIQISHYFHQSYFFKNKNIFKKIHLIDILFKIYRYSIQKIYIVLK